MKSPCLRAGPNDFMFIRLPLFTLSVMTLFLFHLKRFSEIFLLTYILIINHLYDQCVTLFAPNNPTPKQSITWINLHPSNQWVIYLNLKARLVHLEKTSILSATRITLWNISIVVISHIACTVHFLSLEHRIFFYQISMIW